MREVCRFCGDRDLSNIPYGICFECGNHGPEYVESMRSQHVDTKENEEAIERFRKNFCQWFGERGILKCNCKLYG